MFNISPETMRYRTSWLKEFYYSSFIFLIKEIRIAGRSTRLVKVAVTRVSEVSHPKAWVPSKPLKQNMIKPAINTSEV